MSDLRICPWCNESVDKMMNTRSNWISVEDVDRLRQWFNAVKDTNEKYLEEADYALLRKLVSIPLPSPPEGECEHGKGLNDYCEPCGRIHNET